VPNWNTLDDATVAYELAKTNLQTLASEWARLAEQHYRLFYSVAPRKVAELASVNVQHILVDAFFVGWRDDKVPILIWQKIHLDEGTSSPVHTSRQVLPYRDLPYTTNGETQELIEGRSERTKQAGRQWEIRSRNLPLNERGWRFLEFMVESTGDHEPSVGRKVNVLEIPLGMQAQWLQNFSCPKDR
jgi:hypothetical protein